MDHLHVVTAVANPHRWESRIRLAKNSILEWVSDGAKVTVVECAYGDHSHQLANLPGATHIPVRARTLVWNKECLLNIGVSRLPLEARHIATLDADIHFRKRGWVEETIHALQLYPVVQPWSDAYDLGPNDEHIAHHKSFARQFFEGKPVVPSKRGFWKSDGGPYDYPHSGYAWAWTRRALDQLGGLIEIGGMGSGDHHMALGLVGHADASIPIGVCPSYSGAIKRWETRALTHLNRKVGFLWGTIEHAFHGRKADRKYIPRWDMFLKHGFDPETDLKRNSHGVMEFAGNKPALERAFDRYMREREEDVNTLS
jgi:hypothetical protein